MFMCLYYLVCVCVRVCVCVCERAPSTEKDGSSNSHHYCLDYIIASTEYDAFLGEACNSCPQQVQSPARILSPQPQITSRTLNPLQTS